MRVSTDLLWFLWAGSFKFSQISCGDSAFNPVLDIMMALFRLENKPLTEMCSALQFCSDWIKSFISLSVLQLNSFMIPDLQVPLGTHSDFANILFIFLSPSLSQVINVLWWYYFSKLIEFMDTFFFILRKNNHQITFLHLYHHASMLNIWWFVMNWIPCGHCEWFLHSFTLQ